MLRATHLNDLRLAMHDTNVPSTDRFKEKITRYIDDRAHPGHYDAGDRAPILRTDGRASACEALIPLLHAKWEARTGMRAMLEEAARVQLASRMPAEGVEALIEKQIATEQATYLVEFFWLLEASGCAAPQRMDEWIDRHNASTTQIWAEVLLEKVIKTAKLLLADRHRLEKQQEDLVAELMGCLGKVRRRMVMGTSYGEASAAECLQSLDSASRLLRELTASKRINACPDPQVQTTMAELESYRRPCALQGPRRKRRLERLLDDAHFGAQARYSCSARLDGSHVVLSASDLERFMAIHMDPKLCRERLGALVEAGLLENELLSDGRGPTVRLFRLTQQLEAAVTAGLEPLRARLDGKGGGSVPQGRPSCFQRVSC